MGSADRGGGGGNVSEATWGGGGIGRDVSHPIFLVFFRLRLF